MILISLHRVSAKIGKFKQNITLEYLSFYFSCSHIELNTTVADVTAAQISSHHVRDAAGDMQNKPTFFDSVSVQNSRMFHFYFRQCLAKIALFARGACPRRSIIIYLFDRHNCA